MWEMFQMKNIPYKLLISSLLVLPQISSSNYGINSIIFRGSLLWNSVPDYTKSSSTLAKFKVNIKDWQGQLYNYAISKFTHITLKHNRCKIFYYFLTYIIFSVIYYILSSWYRLFFNISSKN